MKAQVGKLTESVEKHVDKVTEAVDKLTDIFQIQFEALAGILVGDNPFQNPSLGERISEFKTEIAQAIQASASEGNELLATALERIDPLREPAIGDHLDVLNKNVDELTAAIETLASALKNDSSRSGQSFLSDRFKDLVEAVERDREVIERAAAASERSAVALERIAERIEETHVLERIAAAFDRIATSEKKKGWF